MFSYLFLAGDTPTRVIQGGLSGKTVIFVHGTGGRADRWASNIDPVADAGYRAYAIDLPGHGFAPKGEGIECSVPAYAELLAKFMDGVEAQSAVLVGTSLGGHVVARYAVQNPSRVAGLVLVGSMGLVPIGAEARSRIQAGANNQTLDGIKQKLHRVIANPALVTESLIEEEFRVNNSPGAAVSFRMLGEYIATRIDDDVVGADLAQLTRVPVLLVWGTEDKTVPPAIGTAAHDMLPASRLVLIEGAAHTSYFEKPAEFNQALIEFLRELDSRGINAVA